MNSSVELKIDWLQYKAAKYACEKWHYSGTIPKNKSNYFGVWEDGVFCGAIIFGLGASPSLGKRFGLGVFEVCELTRVALRHHKHPITRMIRVSLGMARRRQPGLKACISFADPFHGHHGGIYQAGNWIYLGRTSPSKVLRLASGCLVDYRRFNGHGHNRKRRIPAGSIEIKTPGKHRYLMPLDRNIEELVRPLAQPYPKRAKQGTDGDHPLSGGAAPTRTLQDA